jgi:hypothetical protein
MTPSPTQRSWINPEKARYYQVFLDQDLFGDWTLIKVWGGIGSNRGRMHSTGVVSYKAGIELVDEIARRRARRGYDNIPSPSCGIWPAPNRRSNASVIVGQPKHRIGHPALEALVVHELLEQLGVVLDDGGHHPQQGLVVFNPGVLLV